MQNQKQNKQTNQEQKYTNQLAFVIDIDGTLINNYKPVKDAKQTIDVLNQKNIPIILLTNNIALSQQTKADQVNNIVKPQIPFKGQQVILNTTPLKHAIDWKQKNVLVIGRQKKWNPYFLQQLHSYITIQQYCSLFPESVPLSARQKVQSTQEANYFKQKVYKRFNLLKQSEQSIKKQQIKISKFDIKFDVILISNCPAKWQESYQIIIDHLCTQDGSLSKQSQYKYVQNHIPIVTSLNDLFFSNSQHNLPRLLMKPFTEGLKSVYKTIFKKDLKISTYGKPQKFTFQYTILHAQKIYGPIKKFVLIGDNQSTDIKGAYNFGWESILVKTGVTKHNSKMATYNCDSMLQGIRNYVQIQK